eukprot:7390224-Prymnesium_polylepis.2
MLSVAPAGTRCLARLESFEIVDPLRRAPHVRGRCGGPRQRVAPKVGHAHAQAHLLRRQLKLELQRPRPARSLSNELLARKHGDEHAVGSPHAGTDGHAVRRCAVTASTTTSPQGPSQRTQPKSVGASALNEA